MYLSVNIHGTLLDWNFGFNMSPYYHSLSTVKKYGGQWSDYIQVHDWFDETKAHTGDWTHRALRHHSVGVQWAIEKFGHIIINSMGQSIPVKLIAELHIEEDCGFIPTPADYLKQLKNKPEKWMLTVKVKSKEIID